jgi:hypothetical protein
VPGFFCRSRGCGIGDRNSSRGSTAGLWDPLTSL